jgi:Carboxypeptidase regulatory-like domain
MRKLLTLVALLFITALAGYGQAISVNGGSIQGTITDVSGAVIPNAVVVIKGNDTSSTKTLKSDSKGFYSVGPLNPGPYTVSISAPGFEKLDVKTIVQTGTATSGSFKLTIGASTETVEVNAGAIQLNTEQAGVSGVITTSQLDTLPVNGRNILDFAQLQPGVQLQAGGSMDGGFDPTKAGYSALSFSGVSGRTTRILLDGQDITDETVGTTIYNVSQGSISEMQVNRATNDVSGDITSSGSVLASTRSGTNSFHGQGFYDFQDQRVGAASYQGVGNPFQRNQFGGGVGGPILKDKLFFFADVERLKQDQSAGVNLATPFVSIQQAFPQVASPARDTYSAGRLDYNGPKSTHFFVRINYEANSFNTGSDYSTYANRDNAPGIASGADFVTGRFTHSIRGSYEKFHNLIGDTTAGNTSIYNPVAGIGFAYTAGPFGSGPNPNAPQQTFQSDKQLRYDGSWTKGAHNVRYGGSLNRIQGGGLAAFFGYGPQVTLDPSGLLDSCDTAGTCQPAVDYTPFAIQISNGLGYASEIPGFGLPGGSLSDWRIGFYAVDSWKIAPTFTLILGARYGRDTGRSNSDLAPIPCSEIVASNFSSVPCTGNSQLLDQWGPGLGNRVAQPNKNVGPQVGFTYNPGRSPKTVLRGGFGIYYESNVFNNVQFDRSSRLPFGKFASYPVICGPFGDSYPIAGKGNVTATSTGIAISTICSEPVSQSATAILQLQADARAGGAQNIPNVGFAGNNLDIQSGAISYAPGFRSPYSVDFNFGIQRELVKGMILTADYVHIATMRIQQTIDQNHVGDSRYLNVANAQAAIASTLSLCGAPSISASLAPGGCPGLHPATPTSSAGSAVISDFASNGLDSGVQLNGGAPNTLNGAAQAAFNGVNPNVGVGTFSFPEGRSGYDGLQLNLRQERTHPLPGFTTGNIEVSYAYSRFISSTGFNGLSTSDSFFAPPSYDNRNISGTMGYAGLDRTNILSFGGGLTAKYGPRIGVIGHFESATPLNLAIDENGAAPGEIFRSDVNGDGQVGDLVPGTLPGAYMRKVKPGSLNTLINNYNSGHSGTLTPAGQALIDAGLFSQPQLIAAGAVQPTLANAPGKGYANTLLRTFDANVSYPIRWSKLPEGVSLEPSVAFYNLFNMANYTDIGSTTVGAVGDVAAGEVNGPNDGSVYNSARVSRRTGTFDQGAPRATEFQLKLNF